MQFVANGPDIPDALLQAHEEGRVVFFCGAGVSCTAGLPLFKGLVDRIYQYLPAERRPLEQVAYKAGQFDQTLDLLERRWAGERTGLSMRVALQKALRPRKVAGALDTHSALLTLGHDRQGTLRLVTTNFDRLFEKAAKAGGRKLQLHEAPMLPVPKNSRWNGLVYLHGALPRTNADTQALQRLVVTSGDFGLAYLVERWAARFVSELFRNYIVCFVGYSLNDPIMRYMMDALAADRLLGAGQLPAYAFAEYWPNDDQHRVYQQWEAKNVTPLLFDAADSFAALHGTLQKWALTYEDGVQGRMQIVAQYAALHPQHSTREDDFIGRMLWALQHESGLPAEHLAKAEPLPPIEWLEAFASSHLAPATLPSLDKTAAQNPADACTLLTRPVAQATPPRMSMHIMPQASFDAVMLGLANWLVRYLHEPRLILWLAQQGGQLHPGLSFLLGHRLAELGRKEKLPPALQSVWQLLLAGKVGRQQHGLAFHDWLRQVELQGVTPVLRSQLRSLLQPFIRISDLCQNMDEAAADVNASRPQDLFHCRVESIDQTAQYDLLSEPCAAIVADRHLLAEDYQQLLLDAMYLRQELGMADSNEDFSHYSYASIHPHEQNMEFPGWDLLIPLLRDSWLALVEKDAPRALHMAQGWMLQPFPVFRRLALFAASQWTAIPAGQWLNWLLGDGGRWLWSSSCCREVSRLLVLRGGALQADEMARLETAILQGVPEQMATDVQQRVLDRCVWLRLSKLRESGALLSERSIQHLQSLAATYPEWPERADERAEFAVWHGSISDRLDQLVQVPHELSELIAWLRQRPEAPSVWYEDDWSRSCRERKEISLQALRALAGEQHWPVNSWREALQEWRATELIAWSWSQAAAVIADMPPEQMRLLVHSLTSWLTAVAKQADEQRDIFFQLCRQVIHLSLDESIVPIEAEQAVFQAINHPAGQIATALINELLRDSPASESGYRECQELFELICDRQQPALWYGRVVLISSLIPLSQLNRDWATQHLLPWLDWQGEHAEAAACWAGFMRAPRLYLPLLAAIKRPLLETANHYDELGESVGAQYARFLTWAAVHRIDGYQEGELLQSLKALPVPGLQVVIATLVQALEGAAEQREQYWTHRIQPLWSKLSEAVEPSPRVAHELARLCLRAGDRFPDAVDAVRLWLQPVNEPALLLRKLAEEQHCNRHPQAALRLLERLVTQPLWDPRGLQQCLDSIRTAAPEWESTPGYRRLRELAQQERRC